MQNSNDNSNNNIESKNNKRTIEQLIDGLALLGVREEIITAILAICNTREKQIKMMLLMADKIDSNQNISEEELIKEAMQI